MAKSLQRWALACFLAGCVTLGKPSPSLALGFLVAKVGRCGMEEPAPSNNPAQGLPSTGRAATFPQLNSISLITSALDSELLQVTEEKELVNLLLTDSVG